MTLQVLEGEEWNSSDSESEDNVETDAIAAATGYSKKKKVIPTPPPSESSVLYIGHLPAIFGELELTKFLKQFGTVKHVRVSRSRKTGGSRGYAFVDMKEPDVAAIVADTLAGYLLFDSKQHLRKRLVCHVVPADKVHPRLFYAKKFTKGQVEVAPRKPSVKAIGKRTENLLRREKQKRAALKEAGIDFDFPGYEADLKNVKPDNSEPIPATDKLTVLSEKSSKQKESKARSDDSDSKAPKKRTSMSIGQVASSSTRATPKKSVSMTTSKANPGSIHSDTEKSKSSKNATKSPVATVAAATRKDQDGDNVVHATGQSKKLSKQKKRSPDLDPTDSSVKKTSPEFREKPKDSNELVESKSPAKNPRVELEKGTQSESKHRQKKAKKRRTSA